MPKGIHDSPVRGRYERTPEHRQAQAERRRGHGLSHTPTYSAWSVMIQRCENSRHKDYRYYGGRGITVCERWHDFDAFLADMGERPAGMNLGRVDRRGGYGPGNCRWEAPPRRDMERRKESQRERYRRLVEQDPEYSRWVHMKARYGLDRESFDAMVAAQGGCCYLCGDPLELDKPRRIHVDHDHSCCGPKRQKLCGSCVRGLSCEPCNKGIGTFGDDPERMRRVAGNLEMANQRLRARVT